MKGLDQGHRSFVATVLLHSAFDASVLSTGTNDPGGSDSSDPATNCGSPNSGSKNNPIILWENQESNSNKDKDRGAL